MLISSNDDIGRPCDIGGSNRLFSGDDRGGRDFSPMAGVWKEHVTSYISMSYDQFFRCTSAMIGQTCDERYLNYYLIHLVSLLSRDIISGDPG